MGEERTTSVSEAEVLVGGGSALPEDSPSPSFLSFPLGLTLRQKEQPWEELDEIEIRVGTRGQLWAVRGEQLSSVS